MGNGQIAEIHEPVKLNVLTNVVFKQTIKESGKETDEIKGVFITDKKGFGLDKPYSFVKLEKKWQWFATDRRIVYQFDGKETDVSYQHVVQVTTGQDKVSYDLFSLLIEWLFKKPLLPKTCFYAYLTTQIGSIILTGTEIEIKSVSSIIREEKENIIKMITAQEVRRQVIGTASRSEEIHQSIERLAKLAGDGYITMEEFKQKKQELLNNL